MNNFMSIVIVPMGYSDIVIKAANEVGATGATIFRARGADSTHHEGFFRFKVEPEEEIIMITANKQVTDAVCKVINEEFINHSSRSGAVYILPVQSD